MKQFTDLVKKISIGLDKLAGICIAAVMVLVVLNIIMRTVFKHPIMGTYELVGFLTALGVGFALARCALQDGHIAVGLFIERLPFKIQALTGILVNVAAVCFWGMATCFLVKYAREMAAKGLVSSTAEIPVAPFIYLIALGLFGLCLVLLFNVLRFGEQLFGVRRLVRFSWRPELTDPVKKAIR